MNITAKQQLVLDAIHENPNAANDEALLLHLVWEKEGWDYDMSLYANLSHVTRPETVSRRRRELYNLGLITYSSDALNERTQAFKSELDNHSQAFDKILGHPMEQLDELTIRRTDNDHSAVPWMAD